MKDIMRVEKQIQKIINEILKPIQKSFKSEEADSLGHEKIF